MISKKMIAFYKLDTKVYFVLSTVETFQDFSVKCGIKRWTNACNPSVSTASCWAEQVKKLKISG